jgi:hypothetical protein
MNATPGATERFVWHSFDMRSELPEDWQDDILRTVQDEAVVHDLRPDSVTSREANTDDVLPFSMVGGLVIAKALPWLFDMYNNRFRSLAQSISAEPVIPTEDTDYGITLNVQRGNLQSYECHVDSNPVQALLYVTSHPEGKGGELVVANDGDVPDRQAVDANPSRIYPVAGHLVIFDARQHSHYVEPLTDPSGVRVVAAMTYYTPTSSESDRPEDLSDHLFGGGLA